MNRPISALTEYVMNAINPVLPRQVPAKPDYLTKAGGDVRAKCTEGWIWMAAILQFWMDEATVMDGELFGE